MLIKKQYDVCLLALACGLAAAIDADKRRRDEVYCGHNERDVELGRISCSHVFT